MLGLYGKISNFGPAVSTLLLFGQHGKVAVLDFPVKTSLLVNKYLVSIRLFHARLSTHWLSSSPNPNRPSSPQPHENTTPSLVTTATWELPQLTEVTSKLNSVSINFGFDELDQSPWPRQPCSPRPQVMTMPLSVTNTVYLPPQQTLWMKTKL